MRHSATPHGYLTALTRHSQVSRALNVRNTCIKRASDVRQTYSPYDQSHSRTGSRMISRFFARDMHVICTLYAHDPHVTCKWGRVTPPRSTAGRLIWRYTQSQMWPLMRISYVIQKSLSPACDPEIFFRTSTAPGCDRGIRLRKARWFSPACRTIVYEGKKLLLSFESLLIDCV